MITWVLYSSVSNSYKQSFPSLCTTGKWQLQLRSLRLHFHPTESCCFHKNSELEFFFTFHLKCFAMWLWLAWNLYGLQCLKLMTVFMPPLRKLWNYRHAPLHLPRTLSHSKYQIWWYKVSQWSGVETWAWQSSERNLQEGNQCFPCFSSRSL